jgi:beta-glucosidase-like glycosyl hydrolase/CubicO group peptidase (beta-lactamase class C family)
MLLIGPLFGQPGKSTACSPFFSYEGASWADSVMTTLSLEEKIAQLFWIAVTANGTPDATHQAAKMVEHYQPGGIIFFKSSPEKVALLGNYLNRLSRLPLFAAIDAEWGLGMRLDSTVSYPRQMTLGAIQDQSLLYAMGRDIGRQMKRLGLHVNFAPVVDVNVNPRNPVIGTRSFGEDPHQVALRGIQYMKGLQDEGILAVAKHFPGHGDTELDSHHALPYVEVSQGRLDTVEFYPFRKIIEAGVAGVMTAHLEVPALEPEKGLPASLSKRIIQEVLRDKMQFHGLVITDAMNMQGVKVAGHPGKVDAMALIAGNDVVEYTENLPRAIDAIKAAVQAREITVEDIERKCRRTLVAKYRAGLNAYQPVDLNALTPDLNDGRSLYLKDLLFEKSLTVLKNQDEILPFRNLEAHKTVVFSFGANGKHLQEMYGRYQHLDVLPVKWDSDTIKIKNQLHNDARCVLVIEKSRDVLNSKGQLAVLEFLLNSYSSVLVFHDKPYALGKLPALDKAQSIVLTYQNTIETRDLAAQLVFGGIGANGRLPVTINPDFPAGSGVDVKAIHRLSYARPEAVGWNSAYIHQRVDSIIEKGLEAGAFPGCCILVAKEGKVVFQKAYGYHTYKARQKVQCDDVYDLASVTKITGPLPLLMKAVDETRLSLDAPFSTYWTDWKNTFWHPSNKSGLTVREILAHQSGLTPYINYYPMSLKEGSFSRRWYRHQQDGPYQLEVSTHLYLHEKFKKKIYKAIRKSPLLAEKKYKYSGLSFMIYPGMLERLYDESYTELLYRSFFLPLGATTLRYNPLKYLSAEQVVPTEEDTIYRKTLIHGTVHDEAAATLGGVSGNAGLFANANDLAKLLQMYLNGGEYGGQRYLSQEVIEGFTAVQYPANDNRRGLGFDKPLFHNSSLTLEKSYPAPGVSAQSYGHSGFTGTFVWIDPTHQLLYVFLSNRVHPTRDNPVIYKLNIRPSVQQVFYEDKICL